jgi:hypothetical protein
MLGSVPGGSDRGGFVPGYEMRRVHFFGGGATKNTPADIVEKSQQGDQRRSRRSEVKGRGLPTSVVR